MLNMRFSFEDILVNELLRSRYPGWDKRQGIKRVIAGEPFSIEGHVDNSEEENAAKRRKASDDSEDISDEGSMSDSGSDSDSTPDYDSWGNNLVETAPTHTFGLVKFNHFDWEATNHPEAYWRKMLLTQPPCVRLEIIDLDRRSGEIYTNQSGVTMGQIAPETQEISGWPRRKWWIRPACS